VWELILTVGLKIIGWFLFNDEKKTEAKKKFIEYIESRANLHKRPVEARKSFKKLKEKLLKDGDKKDGAV